MSAKSSNALLLPTVQQKIAFCPITFWKLAVTIWNGGCGKGAHRKFNSFKFAILRPASNKPCHQILRRWKRLRGIAPVLLSNLFSLWTISPVKITLSCNIFLPYAINLNGSQFRLRCNSLAVNVSAGRLRLLAMGSNRWYCWEIFCAVFRKRYVDVVMYDT